MRFLGVGFRWRGMVGIVWRGGALSFGVGRNGDERREKEGAITIRFRSTLATRIRGATRITNGSTARIAIMSANLLASKLLRGRCVIERMAA